MTGVFIHVLLFGTTLKYLDWGVQVFGLGGQNTAKYLDPGSSNYFRGGPILQYYLRYMDWEVKYFDRGGLFLEGGPFFRDRSMTVPSSLEL